MKKSVNTYFLNDYDTKEKLDCIKELGYDEYFTGVCCKKENLTLDEQLVYAKKIGLGLTMIHCMYDEPMLDYFWLDCKKGDIVENDYQNQIETFGKHTKNFIIHLNGSKNSIQSKIGIERIKRLLKTCEKVRTNLCVENLYSATEIPYIFENITHPLLKICFDCGHKNFLTPDFDLMKNYGKYVSVLHLHDNNGLTDEHKILGTGTIDLNELAKGLSDFDLVLSAEIKIKEKDLSKQDVKNILKQNLKALNHLEKLIKEKI